MKYVTLLELTFKDFEFGEYREIELHASLESAYMRIEEAKKLSDSYKTLIKYAADETFLKDLTKGIRHE